mgnify:CR=1 FL=1
MQSLFVGSTNYWVPGRPRGSPLLYTKENYQHPIVGGTLFVVLSRLLYIIVKHLCAAQLRLWYQQGLGQLGHWGQVGLLESRR